MPNIRVIYIIETTKIGVGTKDTKLDPFPEFITHQYIVIAKSEDILAITSKWSRSEPQ